MSAVVENRGPELFMVNIPFLVFAVVSVLLRCYVRVHLVKGFSWDDLMMLIATVRNVHEASKTWFLTSPTTDVILLVHFLFPDRHPLWDRPPQV